MDLENQIKTLGADKAPRITPADVETSIASEHYFTAHEGVMGASGGIEGGPRHLHFLTFCVLVLKNGFTVTGESACASPENFNAEIGRRVARDNAADKVWPLMGYLLKESLYQQGEREAQERGEETSRLHG